MDEVKDKWLLSCVLVILLGLSFVLKASTKDELDPRVGLKDEDGIFSGRVSKINESASLLRVKVEFENFKYLNKNDRVDFWTDTSPAFKCRGLVVGKSPEYLLMKVPDYVHCKKFVQMSYGSYLKFFSQDFLDNIKKGKSLVGVLLKKQMALSSKERRYKQDLDKYIERVGGLSQRYQILRDKLEQEWKDELSKVEQDKTELLVEYNEVRKKLDDVNHKLEQYKVADDNLEMDRWSLDPKLYFKK